MTYILTNPNSGRIVDVTESLVDLRMVDPTIAFDGSRFIFGGYRTMREEGVNAGVSIDEIDIGDLKFEGYFQ